MKKYYHVIHAFKRSCIEILPNKEIEGDFLHTFLRLEIPRTRERLSDDIVFHNLIDAGPNIIVRRLLRR